MPPRALASIFALLAVPPALAAEVGEVAAESVYFEGLDHFRARDFAQALDSFERVVALGATDRLRTRALQGFARSALELAASRQEVACARVARLGAVFDELPAGDAAADQARADVATLRARCAAEPEPVVSVTPTPGSRLPRAPQETPPTQADYGGAWILTVSAGVAIAAGVTMEMLALDALDSRDAAVGRYRSARDEGARIAAGRAVGRYEGVAQSRVEVGYALFALGGLLGAGAIWAFVDPPEVFEAPFAVGPTGAGVVVRVSW